MKPDKYCAQCGTTLPTHDPVADGHVTCPNRTCVNERGYRTVRHYAPVPVAGLLVPMPGNGLLTIRRGENPGKGKLCLPMGFMGIESWREGASRETHEEAMVAVSTPEDSIDIFAVESIPGNTQILIFGIIKKPVFPRVTFGSFLSNAEALERHTVFAHEIDSKRADIAFPIHFNVMKRYFASIT